MLRNRTHARIFLTPMLLALSGTALAGGVITGDWWSIDGGGRSWSECDRFELVGTIGQPDVHAGPHLGGGFELRGGLWPAIPMHERGDIDRDGDVDAQDVDLFGICAGGPGVTVPSPPADPVDFLHADQDCDGDVDLQDLATLQVRCGGS